MVAGPEPEVAELKEVLEGQDIVCRQLHTSHAFHSAMMDPILEALRAAVAEVRLRPPTQPFVSTVTGEPITAPQATDPEYWANHARATVQFSKAVQWLVEHDHDLFLECGPRSTLCSLVRQQVTPNRPGTAIPTLADTHEDNTEWAALLFAVGSLWQNGVSIDWDAFYAHEERRRIPVPTYPFERQRYWVDPVGEGTGAALPLRGPFLSSDSPASEQPSATPSAAPVTAHTGVEETRKDRLAARLVEILVPVSGLERSQINTSATFLEQGFDSLSLTQVAFAIRKEFGVKTAFSQLMNQLPNVDLLAEHLDQTLSPGVFSDEPAMPPAADPAAISPAPASDAQPAAVSLEAVIAEQPRTISRRVSLFGEAGGMPSSGAVSPAAAMDPITVETTVPQRGIFFSSRLSDRLSASYNESMTLRFAGTISVPKLTRVLDRLVQRHEALRASFDELGSVMRILPTLPITVPVTDLSAIADHAGREERLRTLVAQETARPFELPDGPLFRSQLVLLGADSAAVVFTAHRIICDGWSLDVLIQNLCAFYSEEISGTPVPLPPAGSYAAFVRTVTNRTRSAEFRKAQEFWRAKFASGFPVLVLPTDRPRTSRREFVARRLDHAVPVPVVQGLRALAVKEGYSFFAVVLGALSILLARLSRQHRFVLALPAAEQPVIGQPELVGHCVNLLPFVVELRDGETIRDFFGRVQSELGATHDHAAYTLTSLLEDIRPAAPVLGVSPISAGLTSVKKFQSDELPQSGFSVDYDANPKSFESFEWYLNAEENGNRLVVTSHFDTGLFDEATVTGWLAALDALFREVVVDAPREAVELAWLNREGKSHAAKVHYMSTTRGATSQDQPDSVGPPSRNVSTEPVRAGVSGPACIQVTDDQKEIWLASQLAPDASASYHLSDVIHIEGVLDESVLESALQALVDRHDALRITIAIDGSTQRIAPQRDQLLEIVAVDANTSDEELEGLWAQRIVEPFNLEQGPLFRSILFKKRRTDSRLVLVAHHIVVDGWSFGILLGELSVLYSEKQQSLTSSLEPAMQHRDYVSWLDSGESRANETADKKYWTDVFQAPPLRGAADRAPTAGGQNL